MVQGCEGAGSTFWCSAHNLGRWCQKSIVCVLFGCWLLVRWRQSRSGCTRQRGAISGTCSRFLRCASFALVTLVSFHADQSAGLITCWCSWTTGETVIHWSSFPNHLQTSRRNLRSLNVLISVFVNISLIFKRVVFCVSLSLQPEAY